METGRRTTWASVRGVTFPKKSGRRARGMGPRSLPERPDGYIDQKEARTRYAAFWDVLRKARDKGDIHQVIYWEKRDYGLRETKALDERQIVEIIERYTSDDWSLPDGAIREIDAADLLGLKPGSLYGLCRQKGIERRTKVVNATRRAKTHYYMEADILRLQKERYASPHRR